MKYSQHNDLHFFRFLGSLKFESEISSKKWIFRENNRKIQNTEYLIIYYLKSSKSSFPLKILIEIMKIQNYLLKISKNPKIKTKKLT